MVEKAKKKKRVKFSKESLDSFLNSALDIEFVYMIFLGMNVFNNFSRGIDSQDEGVSEVLYSEAKLDFSYQSTEQRHQNALQNTLYLKLNNIKFKDIQKWDVDQSSNLSNLNFTTQ